MKRILLLFSSIIVLGICVFLLAINNQDSKAQNSTFKPFCGTKSITENAFEGKMIWNANCAACHKLDKNMIGPALSGIANNTIL